MNEEFYGRDEYNASGTQNLYNTLSATNIGIGLARFLKA